MRPWPGGGFAPARPVTGGHAEVTLAGKGRGGSNAFLGGTLGPKKQQALVIFTWPGGSTSRTVKGNMTIRYVMEWCAAFNAECEGLGNRSASGAAPRSDAPEVEAEPFVLRGSCPKCSQPVVWYTETNRTPVHTATGKFECPPDEDSRGAVATELERLTALHQSGALDDDEFRAAKRRLLG